MRAASFSARFFDSLTAFRTAILPACGFGLARHPSLPRSLGRPTTAWAVEALALLAVGFPLRDRIQRLTGLALFMICVLKLFLYDLRELETVNRILSFLVLGLILVGVSWVYTRFCDRLQRYL